MPPDPETTMDGSTSTVPIELFTKQNRNNTNQLLIMLILFPCSFCRISQRLQLKQEQSQGTKYRLQKEYSSRIAVTSESSCEPNIQIAQEQSKPLTHRLIFIFPILKRTNINSYIII